MEQVKLASNPAPVWPPTGMTVTLMRTITITITITGTITGTITPMGMDTGNRTTSCVSTRARRTPTPPA